jgi:hypothetical protein
MMNVRANVVMAVAAAVACLTSTGFQQYAWASGRPAVNPVTPAVLTSIERSGVPAYVPASFPETRGARLYATVYRERPGYYFLNIDYTAGCDGGDACHYGDLQGQHLVAAGRAKIAGSPLALGSHVTGYYVPGRCGASCAEDTISWTVGGYGYSVGAKLARPDLVALVRSAIAGGPHTGR